MPRRNSNVKSNLRPVVQGVVRQADKDKKRKRLQSAQSHKSANRSAN